MTTQLLTFTSSRHLLLSHVQAGYEYFNLIIFYDEKSSYQRLWKNRPCVIKSYHNTPGLEVGAVNGLMSIENAAYLLKYDRVHGKYDKGVTIDNDNIRVADKNVKYLREKDPNNLPWKDLELDAVIESTGLFTKREDA